MLFKSTGGYRSRPHQTATCAPAPHNHTPSASSATSSCAGHCHCHGSICAACSICLLCTPQPSTTHLAPGLAAWLCWKEQQCHITTPVTGNANIPRPPLPALGLLPPRPALPVGTPQCFADLVVLFFCSEPMELQKCQANKIHFPRNATAAYFGVYYIKSLYWNICWISSTGNFV